jgi:hypothetical protein
VTGGIAEIQKTIELDTAHDRAFAVWTQEVGSWWPLAEHSGGQAESTGCAFEPGVGGRLYETTKGGLEHLWGRVAVWQPPRRLAHSWHPGRPLTDRTMVLVTFTPLAPDRTRLTLTHSGWREGDEARRAAYETGWDGLLQHGYVAYLASAPSGG